MVLLTTEPSLGCLTELFLWLSSLDLVSFLPSLCLLAFFAVERAVSRLSDSFSWIFYVLKCLLLSSVAAHIGLRLELASQPTLLVMASNTLWLAKACADCQVLP